MTDQVTAEVGPRASEREFRSMADHAPVLIWTAGPDGGCDWFNKPWLAWTGRSMDEQLGDGWAGGVHPDDLEHCLGVYRGAIARRESFEMQYRLLRADGSYGWILDRATPRFHADGRFAGYLGSCTDISALKALEEASAERLRRMQGLQSVTAALSDASTREEAIAAVLRHTVTVLDADAGVVAMVGADGTELELLAASGYASSVVRSLSRVSIHAPLPLAKAIRTRAPVRYRNKAEMLADNPGMADLVTLEVDRASMSVPMTVGDDVIGAIGVSWVAPHDITCDDMGYVAAVAGQIAQSLERLRLFTAEADARREAEGAAKRLAFLANASRILTSSLDLEEILERLASLVVPYLADCCVVHVLDGDTPRLVAVAHGSPLLEDALRRLHDTWSRRPDDELGVGAVLRTGQSLHVQRLPQDVLVGAGLDRSHLRALIGSGFGAALVLPLQHAGATLGTIALINDRRRSFSPEQRNLAEELAVRAGASVANGQAYRDRVRIADELQGSLLPARLPDIPGIELAARYAAGEEHVDVGGDFYDAFPLDDMDDMDDIEEMGAGEQAAGPGADGPPADGRRWLLVIGDVRGRGVQAAAVTGLARHTIRAAALHHRDPSGILADLNRVLLREGPGREDPSQLDEPRFCTVCLISLERDPASGTFSASVCSAGHPLPRLLRADGSVSEVGQPGDLLGVLDQPLLSEQRVTLRPGDTLVCLTDGITERRDGGRFFEDDLDAVLAGASRSSAEHLTRTLITAVTSYGAVAASDDMAILAARLRD